MTASPIVSVLVTTYNHSRFVCEALDSLRAQTFKEFEVIITDDASSDGTADLVEDWLTRTNFPARFIRNQTNRGICANRNTALTLASGRFVCSLSGDDAYQPERIERQVKYFLEQPAEVAAVYSDMQLIDADGRNQGTFLKDLVGEASPPEGRIFFRLLRANFLPAPATMVRREALDFVGPYNESLVFEDYDMWLRLSHCFCFRYLPESLVRYRVLTTSLSNSPAFQSAIRDSHLRTHLSWLGRAGAHDAQLLWSIGRQQIVLKHDREGRQSLSRSAAESGKFGHRITALALGVPGACSAARAIMNVRHSLHGFWRGLLRKYLARY